MGDKVPEVSAADYNRACFLVGRFMNYWALLEGAVNSSIGKLLGMESLEETIVTANINFFAKTSILKVVVNLKGGKAPWALAGIKTIEQIADLANERNVVVHNVFGPDEDGNVQFLHVKAKTKLVFPDTVWTPDYFEDRCQLAADLRDKLKTLVDSMTKKPFTLGGLLLAAATEKPNGPATLGSLASLLQADPNYQPAKYEKDPRTPREPDPK